MVQLLPSNRLRLFEAQKTRADKNLQDYPKSADPKITQKGTLTYPMRYMVQIVPDVTTDVANYKNPLAEWKTWD